MDLSLVIRGMILGFIMGTPIGPLGIICVRNTMANGRLAGYSSTFGICFAEIILAVISAFSLTFIAHFNFAKEFWLPFLGGIVLFLWGTKVFFDKPSKESPSRVRKNYLSNFLTTFFLMANPIILLAFMALFAGLGLSDVKGEYGRTAAFVSGVFIGSIAWCPIITEGVLLFNFKPNRKHLIWINRFVGLAIIAFAIIAWVSIEL